jgi:isopenicillin N synthase-like dioxygenase
MQARSDSTTLAAHPVDLGSFRSGDPAERRRVANAIDRACRDSGFLVITGHGVPQQQCDDVLDAFAAFFDQPLAEKLRWRVEDDMANRGYSAPGKEALAYSRGEAGAPDLFEAFNVGREDAVGSYYDRYREFYAPNVWPDVPPGLRSAWLAYDEAVTPLVDTLLRAMALALDLDESWFVERCAHAIVTGRAINYEHRSDAPDPTPGQMRMGAHSDYGILTVLLADDAPGLQIFRNGRWHDVVTARGTFVCNIGDMLQRWTNDRWNSTLHRVVPPRGERGRTDGPARRRALARFLDCPPDIVVECIDSCNGPDDPPRFDPVLAGDWLRAKILSGRRGGSADLP